MRKFFALFLIIAIQACSSSTSAEKYKLPEPGAFVEDFEQILMYDSTGEILNYTHIALLDSTIKHFEYKTGNEIAIITTADIGPYETLESYATAIGNQWGVGKKEKNNGLVIAVSKARREIWIATGKGTEKIITNEVCKQIIRTKILPEFSKGNIYEGVNAGLLEIIAYWSSSTNPEGIQPEQLKYQ